MNSEVIFFVIVAFLCLEFVVERVLDRLNMKAMSPVLPSRLQGIYDEKEYNRFVNYKRETGRLEWLESVVGFIVMLGFLCAGGFGWLNGWIVSWTDSVVWQTLLFMGILSVASGVLEMPFDWYATFRIEEKYGFNKTTWKTYVGDSLKGMLLSALLGGLLLSAVVWFYEWAGPLFWLYAWIAVTVVSVFMSMFYSQLMDGSKRSTKANAYFTGLGPKKRIVLYDTLIDELTEEEIVAVLAHEVGHYKRKHTVQFMLASVLQTGIMLWLVSLLVNEAVLSQALGGDRAYFQLGLVAFALLYTPVSMVLGLGMNAWSRKNEYEADAFAAQNYDGQTLISGLKKISVKALSNLTPHPVYEAVYYSHPSLLKRIRGIEK